jgi:phosphate uptake regulator
MSLSYWNLISRMHRRSVDLLQLLMQAYAGLGRTADAKKVRDRFETLQRHH